MGRVIRVDNNRGSQLAALTASGKSGLFSRGYLRDEPAEAHLESDETPVFVLTNRQRGVEVERSTGVEQFRPGSGYRTICVVTDRRIVAVVGDSDAASVDGDQTLTVPLVDVESVSADVGRRTGSLTVVRTGGNRLTVHADADGLDAVERYVGEASQAWIHVENTLDDVKRTLVAATDYRDAGDSDEALATARSAADDLAEPRRTATRFHADWSGDAMTARVDHVETRCVNTLAEIRRARASTFADLGEARWRDGEFEGAHDAYDLAIEEYERILGYDADAVENRDAVRAAKERVERTTVALSEAPLRRSVEAQRAAEAADDPTEAAEAWETALDRYRTALETDWGADERRFAGDPDELRERLEAVVERLVSARRAAAREAQRAGDWYLEAGQYAVAVEEFETALDRYESAVAVARDRYPDAVDHLVTEREAVERRIDRAESALNGSDPAPVEVDRDERAGGPSYAVASPFGDGETAAGDEADETDAGDTGADGDEDAETASIESRLRGLTDDAFADVVATVLSETGWTASRADPDEEHDLVATKDRPAETRMLVRVCHRPDGGAVDRSTVDACERLGRDRPDVDDVVLATSATVSCDVTRHAKSRQVRLIDDEYLSTVIESREMEGVLAETRVEAE